MALGWASEDHNLANVNLDAITDRFEGVGLSMQWYSPEVHAGAFANRPCWHLSHEVSHPLRQR